MNCRNEEEDDGEEEDGELLQHKDCRMNEKIKRLTTLEIIIVKFNCSV